MKVVHIYPTSCEYSYPHYLTIGQDPDSFDREIICNTDLEIRYLRGLHEMGVESVLLYPRRFHLPAKTFYHRSGYRLLRVPIDFFEGKLGAEIFTSIYPLILQEKPDLVHYHGVYMGGGAFYHPDMFDLTAAFCHWNHIPFFGWYHMSSFPLGKRMPLLWLGRRWMKTWAFRHCSGLTSINQAELKRLFAPQSSDYYGINFSNIPHRHTPNTYDPNIFHPVLRAEALAKTGLDPNKRYILMVARLCYEKGLHYIIDILPELARRYPNIHLLVIGEFVEGTDDFQQILRTKIKELRVDGFITFKPRVEHHEGLVNYYNMAEVFVLPTFMDSFAAVNIEALACGIPVVSTNREEIPHYLKPGLGIVVPEHDQLALLAAVDQVLSGQFRPDPNLRECILSQYDYRYAAANLKSWYEEILNNSNFGKSGSIE